MHTLHGALTSCLYLNQHLKYVSVENNLFRHNMLDFMEKIVNHTNRPLV